ncbi:MAG: DUF4129 domain-containing protein [Defluviitaleaceae bacterium]|nr:DUF4129 domain-containing protein [Defluviitaleaceae bacterium]
MSFDEALYEVLQTSRYDRLTGRNMSIQQIFLEWLDRLILWFFDQFDFAFPDTPDINTGAVATVFVVIGGIIVLVTGFVLLRSLFRSRIIEAYDLQDIFEELTNKKYTVADLMELSEKSENRRFAIRYRYIAVLLSLNERQIIRIEPSATNAIILRQIKDSAVKFVSPFSQVADVFHRSWFGHKHVSDDVFQGFISAVDTLVRSEQHEQ